MRAAPGPQLGRRRRRIVLVAIVVLILLFGTGSARFYTDVLWFNEVGLVSVLWTSLRAQFYLGLIVALIVAGLVYVNLVLAFRSRPMYAFARIENVTRLDPTRRQVGVCRVRAHAAYRTYRLAATAAVRHRSCRRRG